MKSILILLAIILVSFSSSGQIFTIGPRLGVSNSTIKVRETINKVSYNTGDATVGLHLGAFARIKISSIYIQPEMLFTNAGGHIKISPNSGANAESIKKYNYNRVDVPVLIGYKIGFLRFNVGPVASFNINTKEKSTTELGEEIKANYRMATWGIQGGIGVDISKIIIDLKYETGLHSMVEPMTIDGQSYNLDQRPRQIILSVGYKLFN